MPVTISGTAPNVDTASHTKRAVLPAMLSLRHLLILSLAVNVSLILRMVYEGEGEGSNKNMEGYNRIIQKSCMVIPSTSFANSTRKDRYLEWLKKRWSIESNCSTSTRSPPRHQEL